MFSASKGLSAASAAAVTAAANAIVVPVLNLKQHVYHALHHNMFRNWRLDGDTVDWPEGTGFADMLVLRREPFIRIANQYAQRKLPFPRFQELFQEAPDLFCAVDFVITTAGDAATAWKTISMISHRWEEEFQPDPAGNQLLLVLEVLRRTETLQYLWCDFWCLPQRRTDGTDDRSDEQIQLVHHILHDCVQPFARKAQFVPLPTGDFFDRAWCFAEVIWGYPRLVEIEGVNTMPRPVKEQFEMFYSRLVASAIADGLDLAKKVLEEAYEPKVARNGSDKASILALLLSFSIKITPSLFRRKGMALVNAGRYEEALTMFSICLELARVDGASDVDVGKPNARPPGKSDTCMAAHNNAVIALIGLGRYAEALKRLEDEVLPILNQYEAVRLAPDHRYWKAIIHDNLNGLLFSLGRYEEARRQSDITLNTTLPEKVHPYAMSLLKRANLEMALNNLDTALSMIDGAIPMLSGQYDPRHYIVSGARVRRGEILARLGRPEAIEELRHALELELVNWSAEHEKVGLTHPTLAFALIKTRGSESATALEEIEKAEAIVRTAVSDKHPSYGRVLYVKGLVHRARSEHVAARDAFIHALFVRRQSLGDTHPDVIATEKELAELVEIAEHLNSRRASL